MTSVAILLCLLATVCIFEGARAATDDGKGPENSAAPASSAPLPVSESSGSADDGESQSSDPEVSGLSPVYDSPASSADGSSSSVHDECDHNPCGDSSIFQCSDPDYKEMGDFVCTCLHNSAIKVGDTFHCAPDSHAAETVVGASSVVVVGIVLLCLCLAFVAYSALKQPHGRCKLADHHHGGLLPLLPLHASRNDEKQIPSETTSDAFGASIGAQSSDSDDSDTDGEGISLSELTHSFLFCNPSLSLPAASNGSSQSFSNATPYGYAVGSQSLLLPQGCQGGLNAPAAPYSFSAPSYPQPPVMFFFPQSQQLQNSKKPRTAFMQVSI